MRFITCVTRGSVKSVKIYEANNHNEVLQMIKDDHKFEFKLKYIRDMDLWRIDAYKNFLTGQYGGGK